jgi:hypothetical protein
LLDTSVNPDPEDISMPGLIQDDDDDELLLTTIPTTQESVTTTHQQDVIQQKLLEVTSPKQLTSEMQRLAGFTNPVDTQAYNSLCTSTSTSLHLQTPTSYYLSCMFHATYSTKRHNLLTGYVRDNP